MVALLTRKGLLGRFGVKPQKPSSKGNAAAFRHGQKQFEKSGGSSEELQSVVLMALKNEARSKT